MKITFKTKLILFICIILLNIILRFPPNSNESVSGGDSIEIHTQINLLSQFGYAPWISSPLSFFGLSPVSYTSAVQFFISGLHQITKIEMRWIIFIYSLVLGLSSIFFAYILAGKIIDDDSFKFFAVLGFSVSGAILDLSTWTLTTRNLLAVMAPLLLYLILSIKLSSQNKIAYGVLTVAVTILLFATHHIFYFLIPSYISLILTILISKLRNHFNLRHKIIILMTIIAIIIAFSIPFIFRKFIEESRFYPFYVDLFRYMGTYFLFAISGFIYLILKPNKSFCESFICLNSIFLIAFVYLTTYFTQFASIFIVILSCIGILNIIQRSTKKAIPIMIFIILISMISFSGFYQFLHFDPNERYMVLSKYDTGKWLNEYGKNSGISNDVFLGKEISTISDTTHIISNSALEDVALGFLKLNFSEYTYYPMTSESYWYDVGKFRYDYGELIWYNINMMIYNPKSYEIEYVIENINTNGNIRWNHRNIEKSKIIDYVYKTGNLIYNTKDINIYYYK